METATARLSSMTGDGVSWVFALGDGVAAEEINGAAFGGLW
jgi:hypothetical protein